MGWPGLLPQARFAATIRKREEEQLVLEGGAEKVRSSIPNPGLHLPRRTSWRKRWPHSDKMAAWRWVDVAQVFCGIPIDHWVLQSEKGGRGGLESITLVSQTAGFGLGFWGFSGTLG